MKFINITLKDNTLVSINVSKIVFFGLNEKTKETKIVLSNGDSLFTKLTHDEITLLINS